MQRPDPLASVPASAAKYAGRRVTGDESRLRLTIDGREYGAHEEDGRLIVHGASNAGRTVPAPRPDDYIVRVNAGAEMQGLALFGDD